MTLDDFIALLQTSEHGDSVETVTELLLDSVAHDRLLAFLNAPEPRLRARVAEALSLLSTDDPALVDARFTALAARLTEETDVAVLGEVALAMSALEDPRSLSRLLPFRSHPDAKVRLALALNLQGDDDEASVDALIALSADSDDDVRSWATIGLAGLDVDSPAITAALLARAHDLDEATQGEALLGLASRGEIACLPLLEAALRRGRLDALLIEAARRLGLSALLPALSELLSAPGITPHFAELLDEALETCRA